MKRRWITFGRIVHAGTVNFIRNASLAIAAMAVMIVTLTIVLFSVVINATFSHTITQITDKIDISVYLKDSTTTAQTNQLVTQLKQLPNVKSVSYLSKADALQRYEAENAGNQSLLEPVTVTSNPLPATILVKPVDLNKLQAIKNFLTQKNVASLQSDEPSYSGDLKQAIDRITHATDTLRKIGVVAVIVFAVISALIIFNTIQMAIFNRRDEIQIERLLGASAWYIRGPFVVESILYGIISAVLSVWLVYLSFRASSGPLQASSLGLLDIGYAANFFGQHLWLLLTVQLTVGIVIGAASSVIATARYLRFKTK